MIRILAALLLCAGAAPARAETFSAQLGAARRALLGAPDAPKAVFTTSSQERDLLVDLLRDRDPEVRKSALRALKHYVTQTSRVREEVLSVYRNRGESAELRVAAARTLSFAAYYNDVAEELLQTARDRGADPGLRAISYKALYTQAAGTSRTREALLDAARYESDPAVRRAAIWALFTASGDSRVREQLLDIARYGNAAELRVEALTSLYGGMGDSRARDFAEELARRAGEDLQVRRTAILLLTAVTTSRSRDILQDLARYEREPELREAAILALSPGDQRIIRHFHLIRQTTTGQYLDPLENE